MTAWQSLFALFFAFMHRGDPGIIHTCYWHDFTFSCLDAGKRCERTEPKTNGITQPSGRFCAYCGMVYDDENAYEAVIGATWRR